jgi:hypothetical protein
MLSNKCRLFTNHLLVFQFHLYFLSCRLRTPNGCYSEYSKAIKKEIQGHSLSDGSKIDTIKDIFRKMLQQLRVAKHRFRIVIICDALDEAREIRTSRDSVPLSPEDDESNFVNRFSSFFDEIRRDFDFCECALICSTALDSSLNFDEGLKVVNFELESKDSFCCFTTPIDFELILKFFFENKLKIRNVPDTWLKCVVNIMLGDEEGVAHQKDFRIITWLAWLVLSSLCKAVDRCEALQNLGHKCTICAKELLFDSAEYMRNASRVFQSIDGSMFCQEHVSTSMTSSPYLPPLFRNAIEDARKAYLHLRTSDMTSVLRTYMIQGCILQLIGSGTKAALSEGQKVSTAVSEWKETVKHATECLATVAFIGCNEIDPSVILCGPQSRAVLVNVWEHFVKDHNEQIGTRSSQSQTQGSISASARFPPLDNIPTSALITIDPAILDLLWRRSTSRETKSFEECLQKVQLQVEAEFSSQNQTDVEIDRAARLKRKLFDLNKKKHHPFENVWGFIANYCNIAHNHTFLVDTAKKFLLSKLDQEDKDSRRATLILEYAIKGQSPACASLLFIRSPIKNFTEPRDIVPTGSVTTNCSHWFMSNTCRFRNL